MSSCFHQLFFLYVWLFVFCLLHEQIKAKEVVRLLKGIACLPIDDDTSETSSPIFALPSKVIKGSSMDMDYISSNILQKYLHKSYLDADITIKQQVANDLGIGVLSWEDLLDIMEGICSDNALKEGGELWHFWLCKWFHLLYVKVNEIQRMLEFSHIGVSSHSSTTYSRKKTNGEKRSNIPEKLIERIKHLKIFPLQDGKLACLKDGNIFFHSKDFTVSAVYTLYFKFISPHISFIFFLLLFLNHIYICYILYFLCFFIF